MEGIYAWQVAEGGQWGLIASYVPAIRQTGVLVHRNRDVAETMRPLAEAHHEATGLPVRLAQFTYHETLEVMS